MKVAQSCLTLCNPNGLYSSWNSPGQNTGVGSLSLPQGIFPTQGSNPSPPHCRWILYQLSHKGSPRILEWVAYPFSRGSSPPRNQTGSPALQVDSLPTELSGKPLALLIRFQRINLSEQTVSESICCCCLVTKLCLFCVPMDCSPPGPSVHGIFQARILEWVATSFSRGSSPFRDQTCISCIGRWILYHWATWEAPSNPLQASYLHRNIKKSNYKLFSSGHSQLFTII